MRIVDRSVGLIDDERGAPLRRVRVPFDQPLDIRRAGSSKGKPTGTHPVGERLTTGSVGDTIAGPVKIIPDKGQIDAVRVSYFPSWRGDRHSQR